MHLHWATVKLVLLQGSLKPLEMDFKHCTWGLFLGEGPVQVPKVLAAYRTQLFICIFGERKTFCWPFVPLRSPPYLWVSSTLVVLQAAVPESSETVCLWAHLNTSPSLYRLPYLGDAELPAETRSTPVLPEMAEQVF